MFIFDMITSLVPTIPSNARVSYLVLGVQSGQTHNQAHVLVHDNGTSVQGVMICSSTGLKNALLLSQ